MAEKVTNGPCENWTSATDLDDWTETLVGSTTINREDTEQYSGAYCVRFDVDSSHSHSNITSATITLVAGNPYLLTVQQKYSVAPTRGMIIYIADSASNYGLEVAGNWELIGAYSGIVLDYTTTPTTWTQTKVPFVAHADYTDYFVQIYPNPAQTGVYSGYIDNISISDTLVDYESEGITIAELVYDSVSVKDNFKYYLGSSTGKVFTYSGDYLSDDGTVIVSRWRSKVLDFSDQIPQCLDSFKQLNGVKLIYKDLTSSTEVTIHISTDGGQTWEHQTKSLGTGSGEIKSAFYHFIKSGEYFVIAIEHASTDKEFMWLRMEADVVPLGPAFEL